MIVLLIIGFLSGIISGMGIGGGTILIPALIFFQDMSQQDVQNINLIYFLPTASIALITHLKNKSIEKPVLSKIIIFGLIGAVCGAMIAVRLDSGILRKCFGSFLFLMGIVEFFKKEKQGQQPPDINKNKQKTA